MAIRVLITETRKCKEKAEGNTETEKEQSLLRV